MRADEVYAILNKKIKKGGVTKEQINEAVAEYFNEHPVTIKTDDTLQLKGEPADAKATGDAIDDLKEKLASSVYPTTWRQLAESVSNGFAKEVVNIGDEISNTWTDADAKKEYDFPLRVNHFEDVELENGATVPGMWLESKYTTPFGVQFSQYQAFYVADDGLDAGTYNVKIGITWGIYLKENDYWNFTLTKPVPAGGKIAGFQLAADRDSSNWDIRTYSADGKTLIEQVAVKSGEAGTNLCTLTRYGDETSNGLQQTAYGDNRYATSAIRQWLNSDKSKGEWWTAQSEYDIAPDQLTAKDGYLKGVDPELLRVMLPVKCVTYCNTVTAEGIEQVKDVTYDKVSLISLEQMYANTQVKGEGEPHEYYKQLNGTDTPYPWYTNTAELVSYGADNHFTAQHRRLRSAHRGGACIAWIVDASGYVDFYNACGAFRYQPLVCIGKIK